MMILITGGSRSGKSSLGERLLSDWNGRKLYLATMMPRGEESARAIERHRVMRAGKGFETVERYTDVGALSLPDGCGVLLECMGNLLANEMFEAGEPDPCGKIIADVRRLSERAGRLIVITNQVDSDGMDVFVASFETIDGALMYALGVKSCAPEHDPVSGWDRSGALKERGNFV